MKKMNKPLLSVCLQTIISCALAFSPTVCLSMSEFADLPSTPIPQLPEHEMRTIEEEIAALRTTLGLPTNDAAVSQQLTNLKESKIRLRDQELVLALEQERLKEYTDKKVYYDELEKLPVALRLCSVSYHQFLTYTVPIGAITLNCLLTIFWFYQAGQLTSQPSKDFS